jgi:hypothetical protein
VPVLSSEVPEDKALDALENGEKDCSHGCILFRGKSFISLFMVLQLNVEESYLEKVEDQAGQLLVSDV